MRALPRLPAEAERIRGSGRGRPAAFRKLVVTLHPVAALAKQLQVLQAAAATPGVWNYVMEFQILR